MRHHFIGPKAATQSVLCAALAAVLSACGGGGGSDSTVAAVTASASQSQATQLAYAAAQQPSQLRAARTSASTSTSTTSTTTVASTTAIAPTISSATPWSNYIKLVIAAGAGTSPASYNGSCVSTTTGAVGGYAGGQPVSTTAATSVYVYNLTPGATYTCSATQVSSSGVVSPQSASTSSVMIASTSGTTTTAAVTTTGTTTGTTTTTSGTAAATTTTTTTGTTTTAAATTTTGTTATTSTTSTSTAAATTTGSSMAAGCGTSCANGTQLRTGSALTVRVASTGGVNNGGRFVDGNGSTIKFMGFNLSALEYAPIGGLAAASGSTNWGNQLGTTDGRPNFSYFSTWDANVVRIPLNEASWNANGSSATCVDVKGYLGTAGATVHPDPMGTYRADVMQAVTAAAAAGFYVILDLHWSAPSNFCPFDQDQMANSTNSVTFWTSVAQTFKAYPNVMFELFNEPYQWGATDAQLTAGNSALSTYYAGGSGGALYQPYTYSYTTAGWNQMIAAVRGTGATNVILVGTVNWSGDNTTWLANVPKDVTPAGYSGAWTPQIAATWHTYPAYGASFGTTAYNVISNNGSLTAAQQIVNAGYPVIVTEFGDANTTVTTAPFVSTWLKQFDAAGISYVGWAWSPPASVYANPANQMTLTATGTPTTGLGQITYNHYVCYATSSTPANCP